MPGNKKKVLKKYTRWTYWEYPDFYAVSKGGVIENFWNYVKLTTGGRSLKRFLKQGITLTLMQMIPTVFGSMLRGIVYRSILGGIGSNCLIERNVRFNIPKKVFLGDRVVIGESCYFDVQVPESEIHLGDEVRLSRYCAIRSGPGSVYIDKGVLIASFNQLVGSGGLTIGKHTIIARNVLILCGTHSYEDPSMPIKFQASKVKMVDIGEDVWIGANVVIMPGVTIGNGSVIGAGSIVTKNISPYSVAIGGPAKVIKKRG